MVDVFAGALSAAGACHDGAPHDSKTDGVFLLVVDPSFFGPRAEFLNRVRGLVEHVLSSAPAPGVDRVHVPGEKESLAKQKALVDGISIDEGVWSAIQPTFARFGIEIV
jgi:L-lactate dehydrogenase